MDAVTVTDACPRPTLGREPSDVLFLGQRHAPQDHQGDGDQGQHRRHQAGDGGHLSEGVSDSRDGPSLPGQRPPGAPSADLVIGCLGACIAASRGTDSSPEAGSGSVRPP